jgi:hypothetical protein
MPLLSGPKNSRYTYTGTPCPHQDLALKSNARTLGEAIQDYEKHFNVTIKACVVPLPGQSEVKYFVITDIETEVIHYVDIHVFRGEVEICPKQDTAFLLEPDDLVEMGELVC